MKENVRNSSEVPILINRLEVARLLSVSPGTVDNLRIRGQLRSLKLGSRRLFEIADVRRLIETRKSGGEN